MSRVFPIERLFRERGVDAEVINMGIPGLGNAEELIQFRRVGKEYHPDLVILGYSGNDQYENMVSGLFRLEDGSLVDNSPSYDPGKSIREQTGSGSLYGFLRQNSHLIALVRKQVSAAVVRKNVAKNYPEVDADALETGAPREAITEESTQLTRKILEQLSQEVAQAGASLLIVNLVHSSDGFESHLPRDLTLKGRSRVLETGPFLKNVSAQETNLFNTVDGHPTSTGHRIIAEAIVETLSGFIPLK